MNKIASIALAFFLVGCPSPASKPAKAQIDQDCLLEYSIALIDAAESEANACEALLKSTWLDERQPADLLNAIVWMNPSDKLQQACSGEAVRLRFLDKDIRYRARCAMSCPFTGEDEKPTNCD